MVNIDIHIQYDHDGKETTYLGTSSRSLKSLYRHAAGTTISMINYGEAIFVIKCLTITFCIMMFAFVGAADGGVDLNSFYCTAGLYAFFFCILYYI